MPTEYLVLFSELLEITRKITTNTISPEIKQKLSTATDDILKDITDALIYCSENGYNLSEAKKNVILSQLKEHETTLETTIEEFALPKTCSKCGRVYAAPHKNFYKDQKAKDGLRNDCVECHKQKQRELYQQKRKCSTNDEEVVSRREEYEEVPQE
jgi:hypothetical protein